MDPFLDYKPFHKLARLGGGHPRVSSAKLAYCPLRVVYRSRYRILGSSEVLPDRQEEPIDRVRRAFAAGVRTWEASKDCKLLRFILETAYIPGAVTKIVAFACSTISERVNKNIIQHCLILTLRDVFSKRQGNKPRSEIMCVAQDPLYSAIDKVVLNEAGITVLDDPRAFLEVDESSVVLSFSPNAPIRQIITDLARPSVILWNRVQREEELLERWRQEYGGEGVDGRPDIEQLEAVT